MSMGLHTITTKAHWLVYDTKSNEISISKSMEINNHLAPQRHHLAIEKNQHLDLFPVRRKKKVKKK